MEETLIPPIQHRHVNDNPDSLEIGTPSKGGAIKVYGNFEDADAFERKIAAAMQVRAHAQSLLGDA
jgi:hypothetical protein